MSNIQSSKTYPRILIQVGCIKQTKTKLISYRQIKEKSILLEDIWDLQAKQWQKHYHAVVSTFIITKGMLTGLRGQIYLLYTYS